MKKLLSLLAIVALLPTGSARQLSVAGQPQLKEYVIVEVTIGKGKTLQKLKVPIVRNPKERKFIDDQYDGGGWASTGHCPEDIGCEYTVISTADAAGADKVKVLVALAYKDKKACDVEKEFTVVRGKPTELKAKCRASIKAYYDDRAAVTN